VLFQVALDQSGAFRIEGSHDLIEHLDQRHFEPAMDQVFRHLQADVSAADHHRSLCFVQREPRGCVLLLGQITATRSIHSRISLASGTILSEKIPGRSIPGKGGRIGAAPGESTSLSYFSVVTSPVTWFLSSTVFFSAKPRPPRNASGSRSRSRSFLSSSRIALCFN